MEITKGGGFVLGGSTPLPNVLLDQAMPHLTDSELRILLVIVRSTLGWSDGKGGRKRADWISQSQFKAKTGRESGAISRAIDTLERAGLIEVRDSFGYRLNSAAKRRRSRGRLFYSLHSSLIKQRQVSSGQFGHRNSESEHNKRKTDKIKQQQRLDWKLSG